MILTEDPDQRRETLNHLLPMQKSDFEALLPEYGWLACHHPADRSTIA